MGSLGQKAVRQDMKGGGYKPVLVSLVTRNDEAFLDRCLESVQQQSVSVRVKILDNNSADGTCEVARRFVVQLVQSNENRGFSYGHNYNLLGEDFEHTLILNADVVLRHDYLEKLLTALEEVEGAGMAGGKLHRMDSRGRRICRNDHPVLDSAGIFFTPSQRHFDRGSEEEDRGQYDRRQLVFGVTGAALLCRKEMLEDLRIGNECFDEDFFAYREDADLAWRAQLRSWKVVYEPRAMALHRRLVVPSRRRQLSGLINYHSLKNRYLMRMKNLDSRVRRRCFPFMWIRDAGILAYTLCFEWSSLPAFAEVWRLRGKFRKKREQVQRSRLAKPGEISSWFSFHATARDV